MSRDQTCVLDLLTKKSGAKMELCNDGIDDGTILFVTVMFLVLSAGSKLAKIY